MATLNDHVNRIATDCQGRIPAAEITAYLSAKKLTATKLNKLDDGGFFDLALAIFPGLARLA